MSPLEVSLRRLVAALDDAALAALASRGLLRRAERDRERGLVISVAGEHEGALRMQVDAFQVSLPPAGPACATCSCPAPGICQHILAAVLHLRQTACDAPASAAPDIAAANRERGPDETEPQTETAVSPLLSLTSDALQRWAGRETFHAGLRLGLTAEAVVSLAPALTVQFPAFNVQCHFAPGAGLDGAIVGGGPGDGARWVVAGAIALQRHAGIAWADDGLSAPVVEEPGGAPRTRAEVLTSCLRLHRELVRHGLAHLSPAAGERLATLAVSALGVNLPRLALALRGLADECRLQVARDAGADGARLLDRLGRTHALVTALGRPGAGFRPDLVGVHRTQYAEVGTLDLVGAAAWPWRTASGYQGLTVLFWDRAGRRWNSWSDIRPSSQARGFNVVARYTEPGPWAGVDSPRQLAHSRLRLQHARRNAWGRLSGSARTHALITGPARACELEWPVACEWAPLGILAQRGPVGLREGNPLDAIAVVRPHACGERRFDAVDQTLRWPLLDSAGETLCLTLPFTDLTGPAIERLESVPPGVVPGSLLVGRVHRDGSTLALEPHALHRPDGSGSCLSLDLRQPARADPARPVSDMPADDDDLAELPGDEVAAIGSSPLAQLIEEAGDALLRLAESGGSGGLPVRLERLAQIEVRARAGPLEALAASLAQVVAGGGDPESLLRCAYVLRLHREALRLSAQRDGLGLV